MDYYSYKSYAYPKSVRMQTKKVHHIVDYTPEKYKSTYVQRMVGNRSSDAFYFKPTSNIPKSEIDYEYQINKSHIIPGNSKRGAVREIHGTISEPQKFNEHGILREKYNYLLYENKNWTENIKYPVVDYEKIEEEKRARQPVVDYEKIEEEKRARQRLRAKVKTPTPTPPVKVRVPISPPPPKIIKKKKEIQKDIQKEIKKEVIREKVEVVKEEIERDEDKKKKYLKANFIRKRDKLKNKKYKFKKINFDNNKYVRKSENNYEDNENVIYDSNNESNYINNNNINHDFAEDDENGDSEIKKITKIMEKKKVSDDFIDKYTTKKKYTLSKTSKIVVPKEK